VLEKDAWNFLERHRTNISILEEIGLERELMGKVARMKLQYFGHVTRGSAGNLALTVLEDSVDGLRHQGRPKSMGGASIGAGGSYPPRFYSVGDRGYINSLQLFNNTTCLQSCNVVIPALRHSTAIITLAVAYAYMETRQLCGDCGYIKLPCQQDMFTYFFTTI